MADSVDRVFGHALNTVNKIRTGSTKPPLSDRLQLYGLYKQAMEGDVRYIQDRPTGDTEHIRKDQDKYDAWASNAGMSRTEAKKAYIEALIGTMHTYASGTNEARELVNELEFVWDQVKNNSQSEGSSGSSPLQVLNEGSGQGREAGYPGMDPATRSSVAAMDSGRGREREREGNKDKMRVLSPVSQERERDVEEEEREEFVDAPISQFGEQDGETPADEKSNPAEERPQRPPMKRSPSADVKWRRRVESAIVKMTAEVAALREQLESRQYGSQQRRNSLLGWILRLGLFAIKVVVADVFFLWVAILYLRWKKDRRLEGAVRVMLGDAQAVAKNLAAQMQQKVRELPSRK